MQLLTGENDNRGSQIFQLVMQPPPPPNLGKKSQVSNARAQYTSDVIETEEFIVKENFITFTQDHQLPSKDELRGKVYCKYHNSWNHSTNYYWSFRNVIQDRVNKEVMVNFLGEKEVTVKFFGEKEVTVKFFGEKEVTVNFPGEKEVMVKPLEGKEAMMIDEDPFPPTTSINIAATDCQGKKGMDS